MRRPLLLLALAASGLMVAASPAAASQAYVPGEVIVKYEDGTTSQAVPLAEGETVREAVGDLRDDPGVA